MKDPRIEKLAHLLVTYCTAVQPGDFVVIRGHVIALPMIEATMREAIKAGGNVATQLSVEALNEIRFKESSDKQLAWQNPISNLVHLEADVLIDIDAAENTRSLTGINPQKFQLMQRSHADVIQKYIERIGTEDLRWSATRYPCPAFAQDADMSVSDFANLVFSATFADQDDPLSHWLEMDRRQQQIVAWLAGKKDVVIRSPNVDLTLSIAGRTFLSEDGKKNMPGGEVFTSPVEDSVNGWVKFTYPVIYAGREVEGVELAFKDGRVINAKAEKNEALLISQLDIDDGARYVGEWAIGTNYGIQQFTRSIAFDEKIGGTMHLAVGASLPGTGGVNQSALHWDMVCDLKQDSEILVDGELLYKNGEFQVL